MNISTKTQKLTQFSILFVIEVLFCFTPLGSIPLPSGIVATLAMIPVILTAILMGAKMGTLMGFLAGTLSFIIWTFMPPLPTGPAMAFVFTPFYSMGEVHGNFGSILICFVPRILVGTVSGLVFSGLKNLPPKAEWFRYVLAGVLGSLTNTLGVLGGIWLFFGETYSAMAEASMITIIGVVLATNGAFEVGASALAALFICMPLQKSLEKQRRQAR